MPIKVNLPNGEIGEFPDGMPDADIERVLAAQFGAPKQQPQSQPQPLTWGDAARQGVGNIPASAGKFAGDMWDAVTSPIQTAKALGNTALGYGQMAVGAQGDERKLAESMNAYFADRYGNEEGFKRALATDPVGVLADASTVFTGVGGALKGGATVAAKAGMAGRAAEAAGALGRAASTAGAWTDPVTLAGKALYPVRAGASGVGNLITGGQPIAEKLYGSAIKPSTTLSPAERLGILRTGLDERLLPNQGGFDKLRGRVTGLGAEADALVNGTPTLVDNANVVMNAADQFSGGAHANTVAPSAAKATGAATIKDFIDTYGTGDIPTSRAQEIKKATYQALADAYGDLSGPDKEARKALAKALKDEIANNVPEVSAINERLGKLMELQPELERALARTQNHNFLGLGALLAGSGAIGAGSGLLGAPLLLGGAVKMASEPVNVARAAFAADTLAKAQAKVGGLLDRVPLTRRGVMYPAYVDRMRQDGAE